MCSGRGTDFEKLIEEEHSLIFENFNKLILSLEDNFKTEEEHPMCPHHKKEHQKIMIRVKELKHDLEVHIEEHDKGLVESVCLSGSNENRSRHCSAPPLKT